MERIVYPSRPDRAPPAPKWRGFPRNCDPFPRLAIATPKTCRARRFGQRQADFKVTVYPRFTTYLNCDFASDLHDIVVRQSQRIADAGGVSAHRREDRHKPAWQALSVLARHGGLMTDVIRYVIKVDVRPAHLAVRQH